MTDKLALCGAVGVGEVFIELAPPPPQAAIAALANPIARNRDVFEIMANFSSDLTINIYRLGAL
jgi:hypothetical protein